MVLLAASVLIVSLSFLAYKYGILTQWSEQNGKRATKPKSSSPERLEKSPPAVTLTTPEVPNTKETDNVATPQADNMIDPFKDTDDGKTTGDTKSSPAMKPPPTIGLMPPPPLLPSKPSPSQHLPKPSNIPSVRPPPSTASSLRAPPNRTPAPTSLLAPSTSTLAPSARPSRKVQLEPGHSPLDWAHLTANPPTPTFLRGEDVPPQLLRVPPSLLKYHNGRKDRETGKKKDAWGVWQGKVYNMTPYMKFHPGGEGELMRGAGNMKAEGLFNETHRWISWESMLGECLVGILVSEGEAGGVNLMEAMD